MAITETLATVPEIATLEQDPLTQAITECEYEFFLKGISRKMRLHRAVAIEGAGGVGKTGLIHALGAYIKSPEFPYVTDPQTMDIDAGSLSSPDSFDKAGDELNVFLGDEEEETYRSKVIFIDHVEKLTYSGENGKLNRAKASFLGGIASKISERDSKTRLVVAHRNPLFLPRSSRNQEEIVKFVELFQNPQSRVQFNGIHNNRDKADSSFRRDAAEIRQKTMAYIAANRQVDVRDMDMLDLLCRI
ncbi:MAG TPA: AAA family ATPase [Candidatus Saccharimonadales bacterium]|nr:AAA family ATPase [Candidatus Saccharimonadales bacterium]